MSWMDLVEGQDWLAGAVGLTAALLATFVGVSSNRWDARMRDAAKAELEIAKTLRDEFHHPQWKRWEDMATDKVSYLENPPFYWVVRCLGVVVVSLVATVASGSAFSHFVDQGGMRPRPFDSFTLELWIAFVGFAVSGFVLATSFLVAAISAVFAVLNCAAGLISGKVLGWGKSQDESEVVEVRDPSQRNEEAEDRTDRVSDAGSG